MTCTRKQKEQAMLSKKEPEKNPTIAPPDHQQKTPDVEKNQCPRPWSSCSCFKNQNSSTQEEYPPLYSSWGRTAALPALGLDALGSSLSYFSQLARMLPMRGEEVRR